jgi:hypothetical protein
LAFVIFCITVLCRWAKHSLMYWHLDNILCMEIKAVNGGGYLRNCIQFSCKCRVMHFCSFMDWNHEDPGNVNKTTRAGFEHCWTRNFGTRPSWYGLSLPFVCVITHVANRWQAEYPGSIILQSNGITADPSVMEYLISFGRDVASQRRTSQCEPWNSQYSKFVHEWNFNL